MSKTDNQKLALKLNELFYKATRILVEQGYSYIATTFAAPYWSIIIGKGFDEATISIYHHELGAMDKLIKLSEEGCQDEK